MKKIRPTCDQCLYHEHCYDLLDASDCADYKDKDRFIELPRRIGDYYFTAWNELYKVKGLTLVATGDWYIHGASVIDGGRGAVRGSRETMSTEEAQQWLNDHGYDDILIGEMHE